MFESGIYEDETGLYLKFGGKIGITVCSFGNPELHCYGVEFHQLLKKLEIGKIYNSNNEQIIDDNYNSINLVFDKVESIDLLIDYLNKAKVELINSFKEGE